MSLLNTKSQLRKEVESRIAELKDTRELLKQITDTIPDVLYILELAEYEIIYISKAVKSFGFTPEMIYSKGNQVINYLVHPDDYLRVEEAIQEMISFKDNEVRENQFRVRAADGEWRYVISRTVLFRNGEDGKPMQILGIIQDVTSRLKTETAYQQEKYRSSELARINALLDLFVHAAAHDLKGPTGNLLLLTEMINDAETCEKKLELLGKVELIVRSLNKTVSSLLDVVKIEKEPETSIKELKIEDTCQQVFQEFRDEIQNINPEIRSDFNNCPTIKFIDSFLVSIFRNMISNALKYKSPDRRLVLEIKTERVDNSVILTFGDNGIGMDLKCCNEIFKPFTRFSSQSEGTGIGLYLVNTMVTRNGGKVEVQSQLHEGTIFRIHLIEY